MVGVLDVREVVGEFLVREEVLKKNWGGKQMEMEFSLLIWGGCRPLVSERAGVVKLQLVNVSAVHV